MRQKGKKRNNRKEAHFTSCGLIIHVDVSMLSACATNSRIFSCAECGVLFEI
uniref:Uncharacterized protein n=1 Tax=Rhizophora mucronata TaxID=61149 RepID=A0A2P2IUV7_RHIMU